MIAITHFWAFHNDATFSTGVVSAHKSRFL